MSAVDENSKAEVSNERSGVTIKDAFVFVPLVASGLAITWEIGFFTRVGGGAFSLFSLSEHVTFAVQALPIALAVSAILVAGVFQWDLMDRYARPLLQTKGTSSRRRFAKGTNLFGLVTFTGLTVYYYFYGQSALTLVIQLISATVCAGFLISRTAMFRPIVGGAFVLLSGFAIAFAAGFDRARSDIVSTRPLNSIRMGEKGKEGQTKSVRILRTGERGVLYFDTAERSFGLVPWDLIQHIEWKISSIWER